MSLKVNININEEDADQTRLTIVGGEPYVLIRVADVDEDADRVDLGLEVGGGAQAEPTDELSAFLRQVADFIEIGADEEARP